MQKKMKSVLCLLMCVILALSLPLTVFANDIGDVNGKDGVNTADARLALRIAIGLDKPAKTSAEYKAADVVEPFGEVNTSDARMILRAAIGLETLKPAGHEHTWTVQKVKGSNIGYHNLVCKECGETKKENCTYTTERIPTKEGGLTTPSCTKDATFYVECTKCAGKLITTEPKLNHAGKKKVASKSVAATCTTAGYDWYECPLCGKNGDTLKALKVEKPALGHSPSSAADPINSDIVCSRCNKTITPSFNSLVNAINMGATPQIRFSNLTKTDSSGEIKKDAKGNEMYNIKIPNAAKTLMSLAGENLSEEEILKQFTEELNQKESSYTNYKWDAESLYLFYPLPESNTVSALTKDDVKSINIQEVNNVDFMGEIPDTIKLESGGGYSTRDLSAFKALGNGMTGNVYKITVVLKEEKYSKIKNSTADTALMHAIGVDIREYPGLFTQKESEDGFDLEMKCSDVISNCTITYYFLVEGEGVDAKYTPLGSRYVTKYDIDQHIDLRAAMPIAELGIDSGILNAFLAITGMKQGDDIVFMEGSIDMIVSNTATDYYLFSIGD